MTAKLTIRVETEDFDPGRETGRLTDGRRDIGAVVTFTGLCRDGAGTLAALELEHYPGMAERQLRRIAEEARARWPLDGVTVIHRHGRIEAGQNIVFVAVASAHRRAAFEAAAFLMDFLKSRAPFWKREIHADGTEGAWIEATAGDRAAVERWR